MATWFPTQHVKGKFSCGILVEGEFAYTSDMVADPHLVESLEPKVKVIFHDCQIENAVVHASLEEIMTYPRKIKDKLILMHHGLLVPPQIDGLLFAVQHQVIDLDKSIGLSDSLSSDPLVLTTIEHMKAIQSQDSSGHDWLHTKRVFETAVNLARKSRQMPDVRIVAMAALLHDIADWKFNDGDEQAGPKAAEVWMRKNGTSEEMIARVSQIIADLSFKGMGEVRPELSVEGMIVQDADRLDALGAIGVARTFATGALFGNGLLDPGIPPRINLKRDQYADRSVKTTTLNHFYEKLLHLEKLMNTSEAKVEALGRHRFMIGYLEQLFHECNMTGGIHHELLSEFTK